ncbi:FxsA family protein, partial [Acinetobacter baumannii]|uniref:FxsA family protein n=1 Tax=Acinetobacter baumannii TaxID=470 RepID=UPI00331E6C76
AALGFVPALLLIIAGSALGVLVMRVAGLATALRARESLQRGELPAEYPERAAYVAQGVVEVDGRQLQAGQMAVFAPGQPVLFTAVTPAIVM